MAAKSRLERALNAWLRDGGDLRAVLNPVDDDPVTTRAEAEAVCKVAQRAATTSVRPSAISPLHRVVAFFQQVKSREAFEVLRDQGLPTLRLCVSDALAGNNAKESDLEFILKVLAMYQQAEDVELIASAARKAGEEAGYMWSVILGQFDAEHACSRLLVDALRDPLPKGFLGIAYLDMANGLVIGGVVDRHPFDTEDGHGRLMEWLSDQNTDHISYAHSATVAIPFVAADHRDALFQLALAHPAAQVRMEAAWAQAKLGDEAGTKRLRELCLDPSFSATAQRYLTELGHEDWIPESALEANFRAIAEMANWLTHPSEMGRPPDSIELFDTRELHWPPTNDTRRLWLVKYTYQKEGDSAPDVGVGMVGSVTFALFGEATADLSAEDLYGLHCAWELECNRDERAPAKRTPQSGRLLLAQHNPGF